MTHSPLSSKFEPAMIRYQHSMSMNGGKVNGMVERLMLER